MKKKEQDNRKISLIICTQKNKKKRAELSNRVEHAEKSNVAFEMQNKKNISRG